MEQTIKKVKPELPSGFRDYMPQEMIPRQKMLDIIRRVFESFGFDPLDTSIVEKFEVLTGGEESFRMNLFRTGIVTGTKEVEADDLSEMALRFDLTVPLARVMAGNMDLPKPFKRYQTGYVFRGEKAQKGRYRGFTQFDADTVGSDSMMADTEIINLMYATMKALNVDDFVIRINNRKILNAFAELANFAGSEDKKKEVFRILDKIEKVSWKEIESDLRRSPENEFDFNAPNLGDNEIEVIKKFVNLKGTNEEILDELENWFAKIETGKEGVNELKEIVINLKALNIPEKNWKVDLSIARGLGYYTGPVFETMLTQLPNFGSVFSGGRYDGLVEKFSDAKFPATGASIGVDRFFAAMEEIGKVEKAKTLTQVIIFNLGKELSVDYLQIADELRQAEFRTQVYLGQELAFKAQMAYALNQEIPFIIFLGNDEKEKGIVQIKDTRNRKQEEVDRKKIVSYIEGKL